MVPIPYLDIDIKHKFQWFSYEFYGTFSQQMCQLTLPLRGVPKDDATFYSRFLEKIQVITIMDTTVWNMAITAILISGVTYI